ncbi:Protein of unknown function [Pseudovibrio ascidiaceicola]|uniref:DUF1176 domain-containing protein n=1 Tax=Pseudovibrio ascidiaceicola TaxID=285279 RepID=A0A1I3Y0H4_9HYPH|nr:DUF1176 domain-containing protein [Pseudovibrio ascidiaceicola]SFK24801.1 Protein of unknown function [Pseudovibrio ascidiaceicola]
MRKIAVFQTLPRTFTACFAATVLFEALLTSSLHAEPVEPVTQHDPSVLNRYINMLDAAYPCDWEDAYDLTGNYLLQFSKDVQVLEFACSVSPCNMAHLYIRVDSKQPNKAKLLTFERPKQEDNSDPDVVFNGVWDIKTGDLTSFMKGRGLGDCGTYEVHKFSSDGYPHLIEFRAKPQCDGNYVQPEKYPVILDRSK